MGWFACSIWNFMLLKTPSKLTGLSLTGTFTVGYCWKWTRGVYPCFGSIMPVTPSMRFLSSTVISLPSKTISWTRRLMTIMR